MSRVENPIHIFRGEKKSKQRFASAPIENTQSTILMEPHVEVEMKESTIHRAIRTAKSLMLSRDRIDFWVKRYGRRGGDLVGLAQTHEGFRGIGNVNEKGEDAVLIPTRKNMRLDSELLHKSLGEDFGKYFTEGVQVNVDFTTGITKESILKTISGKLSRMGIPKKDQPKILSVETTLKPKDSSALQRAIDKGEITLLPGAMEYDLVLEPKVQPQKREKLPKEKDGE